MIRIEPKDWLNASFARAIELTDVLRHPSESYSLMNEDSKNELRQSQIGVHEVVKLLGYHEGHVLIMKSDQVIGWVKKEAIVSDGNIKEFEPLTSLGQSPDDFFKCWEGTPYVWGGITRLGIDCSGLTQRYYLDVLNKIIPKNSFNQRRAGCTKDLSAVTDHDLVFCTRISGKGIHHVGLFIDGSIWHAHGELGVICQSLNEFINQYQILEVVNFSLT